MASAKRIKTQNIEARSLIPWLPGPALVMTTGIHAHVGSGRCLEFPILIAISLRADFKINAATWSYVHARPVGLDHQLVVTGLRGALEGESLYVLSSRAQVIERVTGLVF